MSRNLMALLFLALTVPASAQVSIEKPLGPVSKKGLSAQQAEQVLLLVLKHEGYDLDVIAAFVEGHQVLKRKRFNTESHGGTIAYFREPPLKHPGYFDLLFHMAIMMVMTYRNIRLFFLIML